MWSLHSTHPSLKIFYSGDKSGVVCKVDVEDCSEVADGVCVVLARESSEDGGEGINKIVTADNGLLWTASGSSNISRWRIPKRPVGRDMADDRDPFSDSAVTTKRISTGVEPPWSVQLSNHQGNVVLQVDWHVITYAIPKVAGMTIFLRIRRFHFLPLLGSPTRIARFRRRCSCLGGVMQRWLPYILLPR